MSNLFYLVAFLGLPVLSYFLTRNLTWTVAVTGAAYAVGGILISFSIDSGVGWNLASLQLALLVCLVISVVLSFFIGQRSTRFTLHLHLVSGFAPVINWVRREWLTNTAAWLEEYPGLQTLPPEVRDRKLILMDFFNNVVGLETIGTFMDRVKPDWAIEQEQQ